MKNQRKFWGQKLKYGTGFSSRRGQGVKIVFTFWTRGHLKKKKGGQSGNRRNQTELNKRKKLEWFLKGCRFARTKKGKKIKHMFLNSCALQNFRKGLKLSSFVSDKFVFLTRKKSKLIKCTSLYCFPKGHQLLSPPPLHQIIKENWKNVMMGIGRASPTSEGVGLVASGPPNLCRIGDY